MADHTPQAHEGRRVVSTDASKQLHMFDVDKLLRRQEVVTGVADIQSSVARLRQVYGLDRPALSRAMFGLSKYRRTLLSTALGATATASAVRAGLAQQKSLADHLTGQLATFAGVNARIDLGQSVAAGLGLKPQQFYRLPEVFVGDPGGLSETMRELSQVDVFGSAGKNKFDKWIVGFKPHLGQLFSLVERLARDREALAEGSVLFVERHGWPLPLALPPGSVRRIIALVDRPKREVRRAMVNAFAPRSHAFLYSRDTLMESETFSSRKRPIEQAVRALRRRDHYAAICTMLPLIEGVLVDVAFGRHNAPEHKAVKEALDKLAPPGSAEEGWALRMIETLLLSGAGGVALFSTFDRKDYGVLGESRRLNRHAILHGSARRYGTQENSLKLFLLLVAMADALDDKGEGSAPDSGLGGQSGAPR